MRSSFHLAFLVLALVSGGCIPPQSTTTRSLSTWRIVPLTPTERAERAAANHVAGILNQYDREVEARDGNPGDTLNRFFEAVRAAQAFLGRDGARGACGFANIVRNDIRRWNTDYVRDQSASYQSRATIYFDDDVEAICASVGSPSRAASTSESYMRRTPPRTTTYQLCWQNGVTIPCPSPFPEYLPRR